MNLPSPRNAKQLLIALALLATHRTFLAQQGKTTGTVEGHITCADTQLPAHLAGIDLIRVREPGQKASDSGLQIASGMTGIDGSFVLQVAPGDYYVTGDLAGYDDHRFDREELNHPTKELRERIADRVVTVVANKTSTINITLHRGGSISGSVRYDDGAPASIDIHVMANRAEGGALSPRTPRFGRSDDLGRFRVAGLPAGEYILGVTLALTHSGHDMQVLTFFYGDTLSPKAAKVIKLSEGESASGFDLTLPISGLHTITGSLFNVYGGRIDEGHVGLFNTDNFEIAQADVTTEDGIFRLGLIPDGHYTLRVTEAHDVSTQSTPPSSSGKNQTAKVATYGDFDAPLEVIGDIAGLSLTIPNKSK